MIQFENSCVEPKIRDYTELNSLLPELSRAVGFLISLGKKFLENGITELDEDIIPVVNSLMKGKAFTRVLTSYT